MKVLVTISRFIVGVLFIISGFIKLNDPVGFSFKLEEYFSPDVLNLEFLVPYSLIIALFVVIFEVLLGVLLLIGYKVKFTVWSIFLMIVFFTFLTFYSAYFNKVTDCGCFGDAIKLTPWQSFIKDIILLVLILLLFFKKEYITPIFSSKVRMVIAGITLLLCAFYANYVLNHLPQIDFRPYKIGSNITENMTVPEDAPKAVYEYAWRFNVGGKEQILKTLGEYPNVKNGEFIDVETTEVQKGYEPPIHDYTMEKDGVDHTEAIMNWDHVVVVVARDISEIDEVGIKDVKLVTDEALKKGYKVIGMSSSSAEEIAPIKQKLGLNFDFYFCDLTTLKTIVRSNPAILKLNNGTIMQKLHYNDVHQLKFLDNLPTAMPDLNFELKRQLDSIYKLDQEGREAEVIDWAKQNKIDSSNTVFIESVLKKYGYPTKNMVGEPTNIVPWIVIQHSDKIDEYFSIIKEAGVKGDLAMDLVALMEDRKLMRENKEQIYGSQGKMFPNGEKIIWPIKNPDSVNLKRKEVGFKTTIEEYSKNLYGEEYEYKIYTLDDINELEEKE